MRKLLLSACCLWAWTAQAAPQVVTSIKPIHALTSQLMLNVGEPKLLIESASPHGYQLTPQNVKDLSEADLLIWVGADLETFLPSVLSKMKVDAKKIAWAQVHGLRLLKHREGGIWAEHSHGDEHHHGHEHHHHDHHHDHGHEHDHHHGEYDMHLWLSIANAEKLAEEIARALSKKDPANAAQYQSNLEKTLQHLQALKTELQTELNAVQNKAYLVFHDAYQYFELDYGLHAVGSIRLTPEHETTPKHLLALQERIAQDKVVCVFSEPQFSPALVHKLLANQKDVRLGELDPLGVNIASGEQAYADILRQLARQLKSCLAP